MFYKTELYHDDRGAMVEVITSYNEEGDIEGQRFSGKGAIEMKGPMGQPIPQQFDVPFEDVDSIAEAFQRFDELMKANGEECAKAKVEEIRQQIQKMQHDSQSQIIVPQKKVDSKIIKDI